MALDDSIKRLVKEQKWSELIDTINENFDLVSDEIKQSDHKGPQGPPGQQGPPGLPGLPGLTGPDGNVGSDGQKVIIDVNNWGDGVGPCSGTRVPNVNTDDFNPGDVFINPSSGTYCVFDPDSADEGCPWRCHSIIGDDNDELFGIDWHYEEEEGDGSEDNSKGIKNKHGHQSMSFTSIDDGNTLVKTKLSTLFPKINEINRSEYKISVDNLLGDLPYELNTFREFDTSSDVDLLPNYVKLFGLKVPDVVISPLMYLSGPIDINASSGAAGPVSFGINIYGFEDNNVKYGVLRIESNSNDKSKILLGAKDVITNENLVMSGKTNENIIHSLNFNIEDESLLPFNNKSLKIGISKRNSNDYENSYTHLFGTNYLYDKIEDSGKIVMYSLNNEIITEFKADKGDVSPILSISYDNPSSGVKVTKVFAGDDTDERDLVLNRRETIFYEGENIASFKYEEADDNPIFNIAYKPTGHYSDKKAQILIENIHVPNSLAMEEFPSINTPLYRFNGGEIELKMNVGAGSGNITIKQLFEGNENKTFFTPSSEPGSTGGVFAAFTNPKDSNIMNDDWELSSLFGGDYEQDPGDIGAPLFPKTGEPIDIIEDGGGDSVISVTFPKTMHLKSKAINYKLQRLVIKDDVYALGPDIHQFPSGTLDDDYSYNITRNVKSEPGIPSPSFINDNETEEYMYTVTRGETMKVKDLDEFDVHYIEPSDEHLFGKFGGYNYLNVYQNHPSTISMKRINKRYVLFNFNVGIQSSKVSAYAEDINTIFGNEIFGPFKQLRFEFETDIPISMHNIANRMTGGDILNEDKFMNEIQNNNYVLPGNHLFEESIPHNYYGITDVGPIANSGSWLNGDVYTHTLYNPNVSPTEHMFGHINSYKVQGLLRNAGRLHLMYYAANPYNSGEGVAMPGALPLPHQGRYFPHSFYTDPYFEDGNWSDGFNNQHSILYESPVGPYPYCKSEIQAELESGLGDLNKKLKYKDYLGKVDLDKYPFDILDEQAKHLSTHQTWRVHTEKNTDPNARSKYIGYLYINFPVAISLTGPQFHYLDNITYGTEYDGQQISQLFSHQTYFSGNAILDVGYMAFDD